MSNHKLALYSLVSGVDNVENKRTCRALPETLALDRLRSIGSYTGYADLFFLPDRMVDSFQTRFDQFHAATIVSFAGKESQSEVTA